MSFVNENIQTKSTNVEGLYGPRAGDPFGRYCVAVTLAQSSPESFAADKVSFRPDVVRQAMQTAGVGLEEVK